MVLANTCFLCNKENVRGEYYFVKDFFYPRYKFMTWMEELKTQEIFVCYGCHVRAVETDRKKIKELET